LSFLQSFGITVITPGLSEPATDRFAREGRHRGACRLVVEQDERQPREQRGSKNAPMNTGVSGQNR
jgi:hypothetical protein